MEAETTFVRAKGGIELYPISTVDLHLAFVVFPHDAELNDALRDRGHLQCFPVLGVFLEERGVFERRGKFCVQVLESIVCSKGLFATTLKDSRRGIHWLLTFVGLLKLRL